MRKKLIIILFLIVTMVQLVMPIKVFAYIDDTKFNDGGDTGNSSIKSYIWYESPNANKLDSVPLIVWLHGGGEYGNKTQVAKTGFPNVINNWKMESFEAYVFCPVSEKDTSILMNQEDLKKMIEDFIDKHPNIDKNNIVLMGHSDGGFSAFNMQHGPR